MAASHDPGQLSRARPFDAVNLSTSITLQGMLRGCLQCGLILVDAADRVTTLNGTANLLFPDGSGPLHQLEALPESIIQLVQRSRETGEAQHLDPLGSPSAHPHAAPLHIEALPLPSVSPRGDVLLVLLGASEAHPLELRLKHFERLARLGTMSAGIAHELRNALVPLSTMADLMLQEEGDQDFAQTVRRELQRANDLAAQMLKYSRPRQGAHITLSLHQVIERALALVRSRFTESGARLDLHLQAAPDTLWGDEAHLEQVFVNLLLNATDALAADGRIVVGTKLSPGQGDRSVLVATITDNGAGIDPGDHANLFHPFFTTKRHGTGLGLFLAQRIVAEHQGEITVSSTPGRGTAVRVVLPVNADRS
jgi:signal transduction histidine kinase